MINFALCRRLASRAARLSVRSPANKKINVVQADISRYEQYHHISFWLVIKY